VPKADLFTFMQRYRYRGTGHGSEQVLLVSSEEGELRCAQAAQHQRVEALVCGHPATYERSNRWVERARLTRLEETGACRSHIQNRSSAEQHGDVSRCSSERMPRQRRLSALPAVCVRAP
jgi:hypothetical protein